VVEKEFLNNIFGKRAKPKLKIPNDLKKFLRVNISIYPFNCDVSCRANL
jgi:hypothetical protein